MTSAQPPRATPPRHRDVTATRPPRSRLGACAATRSAAASLHAAATQPPCTTSSRTVTPSRRSFDAHSGSDTCEALCAEYAPELASLLGEGDLPPDAAAVGEAMQQAFLNVDRRFRERTVIGGSVAVALLLKLHSAERGTLHVSNVGDARAVLPRGGKALRLSRDFKPFDVSNAVETAANTPPPPFPSRAAAGATIVRPPWRRTTNTTGSGRAEVGYPSETAGASVMTSPSLGPSETTTSLAAYRPTRTSAPWTCASPTRPLSLSAATACGTSSLTSRQSRQYSPNRPTTRAARRRCATSPLPTARRTTSPPSLSTSRRSLDPDPHTAVSTRTGSVVSRAQYPDTRTCACIRGVVVYRDVYTCVHMRTCTNRCMSRTPTGEHCGLSVRLEMESSRDACVSIDTG